MKKTISVLLFLVSMVALPVFAAGNAAVFFGAVDATESATDNQGAGMLLSVDTGGPLWVGAEGYFFGDGLGLSVKAGADVGGVTLSGGVGTFGDHLTGDVDVAGVPVGDSASDEARVAFIEASMGRFFVRYAKTESDFTLRSRRQTGVDGGGNPVYTHASRDVSTNDDWLWAGVRFGF